MKKSINLLHCVAVLVAVTGHISIFISPSVILSAAGSIGLTIIEWIFAGWVNIGVCLCFVELATVFPSAGGPYAYVTNVFGNLSGFIIMWGYIVLIIGPFWAFLSYTASVYILEPFFPVGCKPPSLAVKFLGAWILSKFFCVGFYLSIYFPFKDYWHTLLSTCSCWSVCECFLTYLRFSILGLYSALAFWRYPQAQWCVQKIDWLFDYDFFNVPLKTYTEDIFYLSYPP